MKVKAITTSLFLLMGIWLFGQENNNCKIDIVEVRNLGDAEVFDSPNNIFLDNSNFIESIATISNENKYKELYSRYSFFFLFSKVGENNGYGGKVRCYVFRKSDKRDLLYSKNRKNFKRKDVKLIDKIESIVKIHFESVKHSSKDEFYLNLDTHCLQKITKLKS